MQVIFKSDLHELLTFSGVKRLKGGGEKVGVGSHKATDSQG